MDPSGELMEGFWNEWTNDDMDAHDNLQKHPEIQ